MEMRRIVLSVVHENNEAVKSGEDRHGKMLPDSLGFSIIFAEYFLTR
jgi:hypothetical protein